MIDPDRVVEILLVDDSHTDALLAKKALSSGKTINHVHHVSDGLQAMLFIRKQDKYDNAPRPDIILLDISLPAKDGNELLAELKKDEDLRRIPIIVFTGSEAEKDILKAYDLNANCYIVKPVDFERFSVVMQDIQQFWFSTVTLPSR